MHSFGEFPRDENASALSQILVDKAPQKYSLSEKACQGILTRANKRGKQLPQVLKEALEEQITRSRFEGGVQTDSNGRGAGKGALVQEELSGTLGAVQDQTLFAEEKPRGLTIQDSRGIGGAAIELMPTLTNGDNPGWQNGVMTT